MDPLRLPGDRWFTETAPCPGIESASRRLSASYSFSRWACAHVGSIVSQGGAHMAGKPMQYTSLLLTKAMGFPSGRSKPRFLAGEKCTIETTRHATRLLSLSRMLQLPHRARSACVYKVTSNTAHLLLQQQLSLPLVCDRLGRDSEIFLLHRYHAPLVEKVHQRLLRRT